MRVIISGPTGAIGHALIEKLLLENDEVLAICHKGSKRIGTLPQNPNLKVIELDLDEYKSFAEVHKKTGRYDIFYHLAWNGTVGDSRNDTSLQMNNISYAIDAVRLANSFGCKTFVGAGSQAEYGRYEGKLSDKTPTFPENGYGIAKLCAGQLTRILCNQFGIKHIWTRILSIYGPYDGEKSMVISSLRKMIKGEEVPFTKGEQRWDYLYCGDAANALYLLGRKGINGKIYVLGSGEAKELKSFINTMQEKTSSESALKFGEIPYSLNQVMYLCADITELNKDTGFLPSVSFEEGIIKTINYVKGQS